MRILRAKPLTAEGIYIGSIIFKNWLENWSEKPFHLNLIRTRPNSHQCRD